MMDWSKGFSAKYILTILDAASWSDKSHMEFTDAKIDGDSGSDLQSSASITITEPLGNNGEEWVRIDLLAKQDGDSARVPLFSGITSMPERKLDGERVSYSVDCYSVLKPCEDVILPRGYYVPAGSGAEIVKELLSVSPAPIIINGESPTISDYIVAEDGETRLSMALQVLDAIGWRIRIHGDGTIEICQEATVLESKATFGTTSNDVVETSLTESTNWYDLPNCYMAISEDGAAVARDDDEDSDLSVPSRGREIWQCDTDVELSSNESISDYAIRKLAELQSPSNTLKYTRRFFDDIVVGDIVSFNYPSVNITGTYRITSQSMTVSYGCSVSEEAEKV